MARLFFFPFSRARVFYWFVSFPFSCGNHFFRLMVIDWCYFSPPLGTLPVVHGVRLPWGTGNLRMTPGHIWVCSARAFADSSWSFLLLSKFLSHRGKGAPCGCASIHRLLPAVHACVVAVRESRVFFFFVLFFFFCSSFVVHLLGALFFG